MHVNSGLTWVSKREELLLSNTWAGPNACFQKAAHEALKPNRGTRTAELPSARNPRCHLSGGGRLPLLGGVVYQGSIRQAPCWEVAASPGLQRTHLYLPAVPKGVLATTKMPTGALAKNGRPATDTRATLPRSPPPPRAAKRRHKLRSAPRSAPHQKSGPRAVRDAPYLCGLPRACARLGKAAAAAAAVATVKPLGPGRGTAQPEYRAPRASRPKRI